MDVRKEGLSQREELALDVRKVGEKGEHCHEKVT